MSLDVLFDLIAHTVSLNHERNVYSNSKRSESSPLTRTLIYIEEEKEKRENNTQSHTEKTIDNNKLGDDPL